VRIAFLITGMTMIALGLVHLRRQEMNLQHEIQVLEFQKPEVRRQLWDRQARIGRLTTPEAIRRTIEARALEVNSPSPMVSSGSDGSQYR
jgi:hypothetical protein